MPEVDRYEIWAQDALTGDEFLAFTWRGHPDKGVARAYQDAVYHQHPIQSARAVQIIEE